MSLIHFLGGAVVKTLPAGAGDTGEEGPIPGWGRSLREGKGYPVQCSGLENSMDCIVHEVEKNQTRLSDFQFLSPPLRLRDSFLL